MSPTVDSWDAPDPPKRIHFLGICGKAMGGIAVALAHEGWQVTGSDENFYPPMSGVLFKASISIASPYRPSNVPAETDFVVVGKRVSEDNPELAEVLRRDLPCFSFPAFLRRFFLQRSRNAVVAGGLGKTTTTAMLAWILEHGGRSPDYLIGGMARNFASSARFNGSDWCILEGDEYASCFDDPAPKFVHYNPEVAVITNVLEDHPDVYRNQEELCGAFCRLVELLPSHGRLVIPSDDKAAAIVAAGALSEVMKAGFDRTADEQITHLQLHAAGSRFRWRGIPFEIRAHGRMSVRNAAMAAMAAEPFGVSPRESAEALALFEGVQNRQEEEELGPCTLVFDKACHPRALEALAGGLRQRFGRRRLVSIIQPRATGGRHWIYQRELPSALACFDRVILTAPYEHAPRNPGPWAGEPFSLELLTDDLRALGITVRVAEAHPELHRVLRDEVREGDVLVISSMEQSVGLRDGVRQTLRGEIMRTSACVPFPREPLADCA